MSCKMSQNAGPLSIPIGIRTTNSSRRLSSSNQISGLLATSGSKDHRLNSYADSNADSDHARITMKTRVAVRDNTPHRFQVVPLRDASRLAVFGGGRPSQLALPPASHTLLRSASIRRQTCSQVRPASTASHSQVDINTRDNYKVKNLAEIEPLATPCAELTMPILALSPSHELDNLGKSHVLAEQDMNRQYTKSTIHNFESSITTPTKTPRSYDASHHIRIQKPAALFSNRDPSIHSTSQSSNIALYNSGTYPKISKRNIPEYFIATIQSSDMESKSPRKKRTRSENIPNTCDNKRDGPAAADSRMTKRHAIYTQSLYVPFIESSGYFPEGSTRNKKDIDPNETVSDSHRTHHPESDPFSQTSQTSGITKTDSDEHNSPPRRSLRLLKPWVSTTVLHTGPHRGLKYHRLSHVYPLSAEATSHIIYPQIIREMFTDIDRAIYEWRRI